MKGANSGCIILFGLFWCGFIATFDVFALRSVAWEIGAIRFPTAQGVVTESEVRRVPRSRGRSHSRAEVSYRFTVNGQEWTSTDTAGWRMQDSRRKAAAQKVAANPVGKTVTVFYDPSAPARSTLDPGLQPSHLQIALFLTPFHAIGLFFAMPLIRHLRARGAARPLLEPTNDLRMRVRLPAMAPWVAGTIALVAASFVTMFALLFVDPLTMPAALGGWGVVLAAAAYFGWRQKARITAGERDLIIDAQAQTVTLPTIAGRWERLTVPFAEIGGLNFRLPPAAITYTNKWGMTVTEKHGGPRYELALVKADTLRLPICRSVDEAQLRAIAGALTDTFGWRLTELPS